jgi:DUF2993 family protein
MRRLITVLVVLVLIVVAADRLIVWFAERTIAEQIQKTAELTDRPDVSVRGFPFITQALRGRYREMDVALTDPAVDGGLKIDSLDIRLRGVRITLSDAANRRVDTVPVDEATAVARVSFASLNAAAKQNLEGTRSSVEFAPGGEGNRLAVTGNYRSSGLSAKIDAEAVLTTQDGDLIVELAPEALNGIPRPIRQQVSSVLKKASRLPDLPYGFQAKSVTVQPSGVSVQATSSTLDLHR